MEIVRNIVKVLLVIVACISCNDEDVKQLDALQQVTFQLATDYRMQKAASTKNCSISSGKEKPVILNYFIGVFEKGSDGESDSCVYAVYQENVEPEVSQIAQMARGTYQVLTFANLPDGSDCQAALRAFAENYGAKTYLDLNLDSLKLTGLPAAGVLPMSNQIELDVKSEGEIVPVTLMPLTASVRVIVNVDDLSEAVLRNLTFSNVRQEAWLANPELPVAGCLSERSSRINTIDLYPSGGEMQADGAMLKVSGCGCFSNKGIPQDFFFSFPIEQALLAGQQYLLIGTIKNTLSAETQLEWKWLSL